MNPNYNADNFLPPMDHLQGVALVAGNLSYMLEFIWSHRSNRIYLLSAILVSVLLLIVFKMFYPYPNMVMDSYVYIRPIAEGRYVSSFPIGYTWFLWVF